MLVRRGVVVGFSLVLTALLAVGAWAQASELDVTVQEATFDDDGATSLLVSVSGTLVEGPIESGSVTVLEAGQPVEGVSVTRIEDSQEEVEERTIVVLLDVSGSTEGEPLAEAKAAASGFVRTVVGDGVSIALVTFSDTATLIEPPSTSADALVERIDGIEASGETAFFDAVLVGARTLQSAGTPGSIVAFTDGADTASETSFEAALTAADSVDASISAVALSTPELDLSPLRQMTDATGGLLAEAATAQEIEAAFGQVAASLTNRYLVEYTSTVATGEFDVTVEVAVGSAIASDTITLLSPREGRAVGQPRVIDVADPGVFTSKPVLWGAMAALFLGLLVIVGFVIVPTGDQRVARTLERGMRVYRRGETASRHGGDAAGRIGRGAVGLVGSVPKPAGYDERLQVQLDRASWPLRSAEFTAVRAIAVILAVLVGWGIFDNLPLGLVLAVAAWVVPSVVLEQRVRARQQKFLTQLPDTLQLLAGALKAGYGILQGIDTIVKEVPEPTSSEFQRVLTEARLGVPLEDALESMADRIGSEDFRWVTVAINIQRRVGGNLAELLETVSETLREREMVRRQISALSAEGRLSAMILTVLPFGLAGYLWIVNPDYIGQLFSRTVGQLMIAGAIMLMVVGILWMRRLIDIDV